MTYLILTVAANTLEKKREIFTDGLAGFGCRVNLVTLLTLTLVTSYLVDADLAAGVRVLTLVDI